MKNEKLKKVLIATSLVSAMSLSAGWMDAVGGIVAGTAVQTKTNDTNGNCINRMGGGSVSMMDMATKLILNPLIEDAIKDATGDDIKLPPKLMNTCEADKGLKYVKTITNQFYSNVSEIDKKILEALEENDEVIKLKTELADMLAMEDKADQNEGLDEIHKKIDKLIENAKNVDSKKISEASGIAAKTASMYLPVIIGWDKEIAEFSKDNIVWAIKNINDVKTLFSQISSLAGFAKNGFSGLDKLITNNNIKINQKDADAAAKDIKLPTQDEISQAATEI